MEQAVASVDDHAACLCALQCSCCYPPHMVLPANPISCPCCFIFSSFIYSPTLPLTHQHIAFHLFSRPPMCLLPFVPSIHLTIHPSIFASTY